MERMNPDFVVLISADAEWREVRKYFTLGKVEHSPYGEWFSYKYTNYPQLESPVIFMQGGWGKVAASGSTQYIVCTWQPQLIINIGTCGGFEGMIEKGEIILINKTIIYDIFEQMGDPDEYIKFYIAQVDTSWTTEPLPIPVNRSIMVSADRDLRTEDITMLYEKYGAIAGDWESGAIAWVANKNQTPCLLMRGVTDIVGACSGEAYNGNIDIFYKNTELIMNHLLDSLPLWLLKYKASQSSELK
jgi:adenosylhomocysteine nucleosidase